MLLLLLKEKLEVNLMLSFKALEEKKKTNVKINPKKNDLLEKQKKHPDDCPGCEKCEDEKEEKVVEGVADAVLSGTYHQIKTGAKRHKDAVQKKKIKNRKAVPYAALAAEHEPEGEMVEGNQRDPEGSKKDRTHSKQPDPSKDGFTGIGNMSIKDIMKMNAKIKAKTKKEEVEVDEKISASGYARAKKWREDQARAKDKKEQEYYANKAKTHKWDGEKWNKKEEVDYELEEERAARKMNVRTKGTIKKQIAKDAAAEAKRREKKTGEYKETPKKRPSLKKPSQLTKVTGASKPEPKKEAPKPKAKAKPKEKPVAAVKKVAPKPKAKKKEAPRTQKGAMAYDGPNKARSQAADRVKAKTKAKQKSLPKKEAPKSKSVGDRVRDVIKKGVKRHKKAVQPARVFAKGFKKGVKDTAKFASKAKKAVVGEGRITFRQFNEATRLKKEKGYDKGGTKKPSGKKDAALSFVLDKIRKEHGKGAVMTGGSRQQKKVKGAKSTAGTGKYKKAADQKKQTASDAKKRGFKSSQDYVNTIARYGGKDNYDKGKGLGT